MAAGQTAERGDGSVGLELWAEEEGAGIDGTQSRRLVAVRDHEVLDKAGQVGGVKARQEAKNLSQIAESAFPHTSKMLAAYEMLQDEIANLSGGAEVEERG